MQLQHCSHHSLHPPGAVWRPAAHQLSPVLQRQRSLLPQSSPSHDVEVAPSTGILTYLRVVVVVQVIEAASPDRENCVCDHLDHSIWSYHLKLLNVLWKWAMALTRLSAAQARVLCLHYYSNALSFNFDEDPNEVSSIFSVPSLVVIQGLCQGGV